MLDSIHNDYNLDSTKVIAVIATVTDNGSNFIKAFQEFGITMNIFNSADLAEDDGETYTLDSNANDEETDFFLSDNSDIQLLNLTLPSHLRCASHTLNLCVTSDANRVLQNRDTEGNYTLISDIHQRTIKKCNLLWNAANRPKSAEVLHKILGHTLSRPGITRWNSLYDALKQIYSIKEKNLQLHRAFNLRNPLSDDEFEYIKEYLTCSIPIAEALDILLGEKNIFYGILVPCLMALRKKLEKLGGSSQRYCGDLVVTYLNSVRKRFQDFSAFASHNGENAVIAALSYPPFKNRWFSCLDPGQQGTVKNIFTNVIAREISKKKKMV